MSAAAQKAPWLYGPWADLLFGCGLLYALVFTVLLVAGEPIRTAQPNVVFPILILLLGVPHYGATLLRVYEQRRERRAFAVFSVWATLAILALFVATLFSAPLASLWLTLYLTWSPWHYTGQNYGIAVMFLRRAGVELDAETKRWVYLSFLSSFVLVFLVMHTGGVRESAADLPASYLSELGPRFTSLGIPVAWGNWIGAVVATVSLSALGVSALRLRGRAPARALLPAAALVFSQLLWFSVPYGIHLLGLAPRLDPLNWEFRSHYFTWIALAHSLQYLWVTSYYARQSRAWHGQGVQYVKALAAGAAPWTLPFLVFGPQALGPLSVDAGLAMLVAATVNIHHFVLDGAIWKLRGRIADVLIRSVPDSVAADAPGRFGLRYAVWALCAFGVVLQASRLANEERYRRDFESGDIADARSANEELTRIGFDRGSVRLALGRRLLEAGRPAEAREQLLRSLELAPQAEAYFALGRSYERERLWVRAAEAYETALAGGLAPEREPDALAGAAGAWLEAGETERARALFERIGPSRDLYYHLSESLRDEGAPAPEPSY